VNIRKQRAVEHKQVLFWHWNYIVLRCDSINGQKWQIVLQHTWIWERC